MATTIKRINTKDKITAAALALFNLHGLKNVRLQHIADEAGISVGNLAYHFPDMKHLIRRLERQISQEVETQLNSWKNSPHLIDFDNRLTQLFHLFKKYSFYFLDVLEIKRTYPDLHQKRVLHIDNMISQLNNWLEINEEHQFIQFELGQSHRKELAEMIWYISAFWLMKNTIRDQEEDQELAYREAVWKQIKPYFTEKGAIEFELMIEPKLF